MAPPPAATMVKRNDVSTKIDADVLEECRLAATFKGMHLSEYLSESMRIVSKRDIEEGIARREQGPPKKSKGGGKP